MQKGQTPFSLHETGQALIFLLIGILVVAGGAFYLGRSTTPKPSPTPSQNSQVPQSTSTSDASPAPNGTGETANWKTYTSSKANYSFRYPPEWPFVNVKFNANRCTECVEEIVFGEHDPKSADLDLATIFINKEPQIKTLDDYVNSPLYVPKNDQLNQSRINLQYTTVGGEQAVSYKLSGGIPPDPVVDYAVVKNGFIYIIRLYDSSETNKNKSKNLDLFNKMLSTFKFL